MKLSYKDENHKKVLRRKERERKREFVKNATPQQLEKYYKNVRKNDRSDRETTNMRRKTDMVLMSSVNTFGDCIYLPDTIEWVSAFEFNKILSS